MQGKSLKVIHIYNISKSIYENENKHAETAASGKFVYKYNVFGLREVLSIKYFRFPLKECFYR